MLILLFLIGLTISIYGGFLEQRFGIRHTTLLRIPPAVWLALKYDLGFTLADAGRGLCGTGNGQKIW